MIPVDKAVIARAKKFGNTFEILVDPEKAREYKRNPASVAIEDVVAAMEVYSDSGKGKRANESDLKQAFEATDFPTVLSKILQHGEIQLTTEQKRQMAEQRKKQVITLIAKSAVDPRTHAPHPRDRIERLIDENKIRIDAMQSAQEQVNDVLKELKKIIPISMEHVKVEIKLNAQDAARLYGVLKEYGLAREQWNSDGSLQGFVEMAAGVQSEFYDRVNKRATGFVDTKVVERT